MPNGFSGPGGPGSENADDALPPTLSALDARLRHDGAQWREAAPDPARWLPDLRTRTARSAPSAHPARTTTLSERRLTLDGPATPTARLHAPAHRSSRLGTIAAGGSALLVVALLAILLHGFAGNRPGSSGAPPWPKIVAQPLHPATAWTVTTTTLPALPTFSSPIAAMHAEVAPSNPKIIYLAGNDGTGPALQRSDDGGKTWKKLAVPTQDIASDPALQDDYDGITISPLDPRTILLGLSGNPTTSCPTGSPSGTGRIGGNILASGSVSCYVQYISHDGGVTWTRPHLPGGSGFLGQGSVVSSLLSPKVFLVRNGRLYAMLGYSATTIDIGERLVMSTDEGSTWTYADQNLVDQGRYLVSYLPDSNGPGAWALTSPKTTTGAAVDEQLWRTDDGATWRRAGALPARCMGMGCGLAGAALVDGATPVLYLEWCDPTSERLTPNGGSSGVGFTGAFECADRFSVTETGGQSWQDLPTAGIPAGMRAVGIDGGALGDGALVAVYGTPNIQRDKANNPALSVIDNTVLVWYPGSASWQLLAPQIPHKVLSDFWMTSGANGKYTLWASMSDATTVDDTTSQVYLCSAIIG